MPNIECSILSAFYIFFTYSNKPQNIQTNWVSSKQYSKQSYMYMLVICWWSRIGYMIKGRYNWNNKNRHASRDFAGAPIVMFVNIYAGDSPIRKTCNFIKPLNYILKVMDGCMHIFYLENIKTHVIRMLEWQPSPFFTDSLHEA